MPKGNEHQEKASHNKSFLNGIDGNFPDWKAVAMFYVAVHLVERLRARHSEPKQRDSKDHVDRNGFVKESHRQIHEAYRDLFDASLTARYYPQSQFAKQFPTVDPLAHHLQTIETYVDTACSPRQAQASGS
jgi:hypothetical protein